MSSQISRQIVQLHANLYGRGPTRSKTYIEGDYVLAVLEEIFTPAEQTLIRAGSAEEVEASRRAFQDAIRDDSISIVETATGRGVRAFISQVHIPREIAVELYLFDPLASAGR